MVAPLKLKRQKVVSNSSNKAIFASENPVAKVLVNTPLSHLEDIYDYYIPIELSESVIPGSVVKIEFGNLKTEGLVLERVSSEGKKLKPVEAILGWPAMVDLAVIEHLRKVQRRFGGSLWSLIESYLPSVPKKIIEIKEQSKEFKAIIQEPNLAKVLSVRDYQELKKGSGLRYSVSQPNGFDPFETLIDLIKVRSSIGQVLVLASDFREFDYLAHELRKMCSDSLLLNDSRSSKSERFNKFQEIVLLKPRVILGNRSSAFIPLGENSSVIVINDNDRSHYELRSPGWNTRDVTLLRDAGTSLFFFNSAPSFEIQRLIDLNWIQKMYIKSTARLNYVVTNGRDSFIPTIKKALQMGNVLVSVAAKGYANAFLCSKCRCIATCNCGGKLQIKSASTSPTCYLCNQEFKNWRCTFCGDIKPFVIAKGLDRTAEEIARSIPSAKVVKIFSDHDDFNQSTENQVIVSSRGCEPMINYSAVILLDGEQIYNQPTLRSEELIKHNWFELMSRVSDEGYLYISLENNHPLTQQMLLKQTSSPNSLNARRESRLPPYFRTCEVWGDVKAISTFAENLRKSENYLVSGPSNIKDGRAKIIVRIDIETAGDFVNEMQDVVKMQLLKGKPVFEFRFDQYDI